MILILRLDLVLSFGILGNKTGLDQVLSIEIEEDKNHIVNGNWWRRRTDVIEETLRTTTRTGTRTRDGRQTAVFESFDQSTIGDRTVSRDLIPFMRSRNVEFTAKQVLPLATMYAFFDGVDVTKYCVPKLLEISMVSGTFQVGETVEGVIIRTGQGGNPSLY